AQDECRLVTVGPRQVLLCQANVGPEQGILTAALCVVSASEGGLDHDCALRITDVSASGCFSDGGDSAARRHTWAAAIKSWSAATVAGSPGARLEVSVASLSVPPGENMDRACERATQRLDTAPREVLRLELAFDGRKLALTPDSKRIAGRFPWVFDSVA